MKNLFLSIILLSSCMIANAQMTYLFGATAVYGSGLNQGYINSAPSIYEVYDVRAEGSGYGLFAYPKFHFKENEIYSLSIGTPTSIGLDFITSSTGDRYLSFLANIPATVDINFGNQNINDEERRFGGFFGTGLGFMLAPYSRNYGWSSTSSTKPSGSEYKTVDEITDIRAVTSVGWTSHIGGVVENPLRDNGSKIGLRFSYHKGFGKRSIPFYGLSVLYDF